jgi:hypothetical protein
MSKAQEKSTIPTKYNHLNHIPVLSQDISCHRLDWFLEYFTTGCKFHKFGSTECDSELLTNYELVRILKDAFVVYQKHLLQHFTFMWPCIVTNFLIIKPTRCTNFSNLFWNEYLNVSDSSSVHHQELFTVHSAIVCHTAFDQQQDQDGTAVPSWSCCSKAVYKPVSHIPLLNVQRITPDDGQRNYPKHVVSFQNKFQKLVHLVGFIISIRLKTN